MAAPPRAYLKVSVTHASSLLASTGEPEASLTATAKATLTFLGEEAASEPVAADEATGDFAFALEHTIAKEVGPALLQELLDTPLCLSLYKAGEEGAEDVAVGTVTLDLLPLVEGASLCGGVLPVDAVFPEVAEGEEPAPSLLADGATVTVEVTTLASPAEAEAYAAALEAAPAEEPAAEEEAGKDAAAEEETAAPIPEDLEVAPLVPEAEASGACVIEITVHGVDDVPETVGKAASTKGIEDLFTYHAGVRLGDVIVPLPGGTYEVPPPPAEEGGEEAAPAPLARLAWPAVPTRRHLTSAETEALRMSLRQKEDAPVEVVRIVNVDAGHEFADPMYETYHAAGAMNVLDLIEPGATSCEVSVALANYTPPPVPEGEEDAAADGAVEVPTPLVPEYAQPANEKAAAVEDAPADETDGPYQPWSGAEPAATLRVRMQLTKPLRPEWESPPPPPLTLRDLVPERPPLPAPKDDDAVNREFRDQVKEAARSLVAEYVHLFPEQAELQTAVSDSSSLTDADRKARVVFELNKTGAYIAMKEGMKKAVVKIVRERYNASPEGVSRADMEALYDDLNVHLVDEMHAALNELSGVGIPEKPKPEPEPTAEQLARLLALAGEVEIEKRFHVSERCHAERVLAQRNPDVWYDYACYCMRRGDVGKAEECLRECLALDDKRLDALLALSINLLVQELPDKAEVLAQSAVSAKADSGPAWSIMTLVYRRLGSRMMEDPLSMGVPPEEVDPKAWPQAVDNCLWKSLNLGKEVAAAAAEAAAAEEMEVAPSSDSSPFLQAALMLLDLHLPDMALECLATAEKEGPQMAVEFSLIRARCAQLKGDAEGGLVFLTPDPVPVLDEETGEPVVDEETGEPTTSPAPVDGGDDTRVLSLRGNLLYDCGRYADAALCYEKAIVSAPHAVTLECHLRLGTSLMQLQRFDDARAAYTRACALAPCCSVWLGLGASSVRLGDLENADMALAEANARDNRNPFVWAYLTLVNLGLGRDDEAATALRYCFKEGMEEPTLLEEIAGHYLNVGRYAQAAVVLKRACAIYASTGSSGGLTSASAADCRVRLAKTLVELRETEAAIGELISAHAINPSNDVAMSMLVDLYTSIGDDAKAEKFRVALEGLANA